MTDTRDFSWLGPTASATDPATRHVCDFWTLRGPSNRDVTCSAYQVESGLELRAEYSATELLASKLFRGPKADEQLAEAADTMRRTLLAKGFREMAK